MKHLTDEEREDVQRAQSRIDHFGHDKVADTAVGLARALSEARGTIAAVRAVAERYVSTISEHHGEKAVLRQAGEEILALLPHDIGEGE